MTRVLIKPTCGLETTITANAEDMQRVKVAVESECAGIRKIAHALDEVNPFQEMSRRGEGPQILTLGREHCSHMSCPVPAMMIKAVEVAAGMDLPKDVVVEWLDDTD